MALFGLLGGGGSDPADIYGDLFTEKQRAALRDQQMTDTLLRLSAGFAKAGQASRLPTGGLLGAIGEAAGGLAGGGDEAVNQQLKAMQVAEQVRKAKADRAMDAMIAPIYQRLLQKEGLLGLPPGTLTKGLVPPAAAGAPSGGQPADNAPPAVPPVPEIGAPPGAFGVPSQDVTRWGLPPRPAAMGLLPPPIYPLGDPNVPLPPRGTGGRAAGLLPPSAEDDPWAQYAGLLGGGTGSQSPFGPTTLDPTAQGSPDLSNIKIEQLSGEAAPAGGNWERDRALIRKYESGGRNIEQQVIGPQGGYNPSVGRVTGPSSASGYYQMIDPTWRAAAAKAGIDTSQYPRAIHAPEALQDKAAEALYREQGLKPWAPYNSRLAAATGYQGGSGGGSGFSGRVEPLGSDAASAGATPAGKIPGLDISPQGLAALNALTKMAGHGDVFGSLLETYYKSPSYLSEKTTAETKARADIEDPLNQRMKVLEMALDMRKNGILYNPQTGEIKADPAWDQIHGRRAEDTKLLELDYAKRLKTFEEQQKIAEEIRKDQKEIAPQPIYRGGVIVEQPMTREAAVARLKDQSMRPGQYKDGDIVAKPIGNLSPDHQYKMSSTGGLTVEPIAGTPGAEKAAAAAKAKDISDRQLLVSRDIVVQDADRLENLIKTSPVSVTGMMGSLLSNVPGTPQSNAKALIDGLRARASIDAINRARAATGSTGMGQITMGEHALLANALANLEQSQGEAQLLFNLRRFKQEYIDAVHGPGAHSSLLPDTPVVKTPSSAPAGTAAASPADATRLRSEAADAIKAGKSRSAVIKRLQDMGVDAGGL